jgi:hypothetical protein
MSIALPVVVTRRAMIMNPIDGWTPDPLLINPDNRYGDKYVDRPHARPIPGSCWLRAQ